MAPDSFASVGKTSKPKLSATLDYTTKIRSHWKRITPASAALPQAASGERSERTASICYAHVFCMNLLADRNHRSRSGLKQRLTRSQPIPRNKKTLCWRCTKPNQLFCQQARTNTSEAHNIWCCHGTRKKHRTTNACGKKPANYNWILDRRGTAHLWCTLFWQRVRELNFPLALHRASDKWLQTLSPAWTKLAN